jgi:drug/metabolite transporter (DMT)-like permease
LTSTLPTAAESSARGYAIALASAGVLATTAIFIRYLTENFALPALVLAFWREAFVVATLVPVLALLRPGLLRVGRRHLPYLVVFGAVLAAFNALWTLSVAVNGAAVSTVLVYSSAGFTAVLARYLLAEPLDWLKVSAIALSLSGCALVSGASDPDAWRTNAVGIAAGVLSGLGYAAYSLMGRSAALRGLKAWTTLLYTFGFAACFLLAVNLLHPAAIPGAASTPGDLFWLGRSLSGWGLLFLLAAGPTAGGYGLYVLSLVHLPSSVVNLLATTEVVFTALLAYALLGERMTFVQILGGLLIVGAVILLRLREKPPSVAFPEPAQNLAPSWARDGKGEQQSATGGESF